MVAFTSILLALGGAATILASPLDLIKRSTPQGSGTHDGFHYYFWTDQQGEVEYNNEPGGKYSVSWKDAGNFIAGKGWSPGGARVVNYNGTWEAGDTNSFVTLYGWMRNPMVEYYIIDSYGLYNPMNAHVSEGTVESDGGTYDIFHVRRVLQTGDILYQSWSVRREKRVGGSITTQNHYDAWKKAGFRSGVHDYMIVAIDGYQSTGSASITVDGP